MKIKLIYCYLMLEKYFVRLCGLFRRTKEYNVSIIRLDAIGDYILFRNFLAELSQSADYKDKQLILIGNIAWRDIVEYLDMDVFKTFIWIDPLKVWVDKKYRYRLFWELSKYKFDVLISPTYSRDLLILDALVNVIRAKTKIASIGDCSNIIAHYKKMSDKFYTKLISAIDKPMFEFYRNKEFFESLLERKLDTKFNLDIKNLNNHLRISSKYVVLFIGASIQYKRWHLYKFVQLGKWINQVYGFDIVLCGSNNDINDGDMSIITQDNIYNLIGKTSLIELFAILKSAEFVVSNDTMVPHACIALDKQVFVIATNTRNVNLTRFTQYPVSITTKHKAIYHPDIYKSLDKYMNYSKPDVLDINQVSIESVKNVISKTIEY